MKEYWHYECEHNHVWVFMHDSESEEQTEETFCPFGHKAIILRKRILTSFLQVSIRPAEELDDLGKASLSHRYYLVLTDLNTGQERMSKQTFNSSEMEKALKNFYFLSVRQGWRLLDKLEQIEWKQTSSVC